MWPSTMRRRGQQDVRPRGGALVVRRRIAVGPGDAVARSAEELELAISEHDGAAELLVPLGGSGAKVHEPGSRGEDRPRHVRRRVGRHRLRVDGDVEAAALELSRRRQTGGAASQDGRATGEVIERHLRRHLPRAPGERHARAAMAVVVNDRLVVELVRPQHETRRPLGPESDGRADHPIPGHVRGNEMHGRTSRGAGGGLFEAQPSP
jgi:hypothetical protein